MDPHFWRSASKFANADERKGKSCNYNVVEFSVWILRDNFIVLSERAITLRVHRHLNVTIAMADMIISTSPTIRLIAHVEPKTHSSMMAVTLPMTMPSPNIPAQTKIHNAALMARSFGR